MSRMSWPAAPGQQRPALLAAPGRDAAVATVAVLLTVGVFAAVGEHGAGILLGTACAVVTALIVGQIQRHAEGRQNQHEYQPDPAR
jgi:hypothetical protein